MMGLSNQFPLFLALAVILFSLGLLWLILAAIERMRGVRTSTQLMLRHSENLSYRGKLSDLLGEGDTVLDRLIRRMAKLMLEEEPESNIYRDELSWLMQAGFRGSRAVILFSALRIALPVAGVVVLSLSWIGSTLDVLFFVYAYAVFTIGYMLPKYLLKMLASKRMKKFTDELPLFVDFLRMLQGVGLNLEQSLMVMTDTHFNALPIMSDEIREVTRQISSGRSRSQAFEKMANQLRVVELRELVAILVQAERFGGSLQEPLLQYSKQMVQRRHFKMQAQIGQTATKMTVVMVLFLFPALLIVTAGPGVLAILKALSR
jgi:tight adherence protein C